MKKIFLVTKDGFSAPNAIWKFLHRYFIFADDEQEADIIFALGGDGTMLSAIRSHWHLGKPFCGINFGHLGFLLNSNLPKVLAEIAADDLDVVENRMLRAKVSSSRNTRNEYVINDVYFRGDSGVMAKIKVTIDGKPRFDPLACDGVVVATAAGSTAYNAAAGGTILPIGTENMVLTGISPAIYHHFRTIQLSANAEIILEPKETGKRPAFFFADGQKLEGIKKATITLSKEKVVLLFAKSEKYHRKVQDIQFAGWKS